MIAMTMRGETVEKAENSIFQIVVSERVVSTCGYAYVVCEWSEQVFTIISFEQMSLGDGFPAPSFFGNKVLTSTETH